MACCGLFGSSLLIASESSITLTEAAKEYASQALGMSSDQIEALHVDPRLPLGECTSGWQFGFAFNSRTTVEVACDEAGRPKRYVALRLPPEPVANVAGPSHVVAAKDLPFGHVVRLSDLKLATAAPGDRPPPQALSSMDDLLGQSLTGRCARERRSDERMCVKPSEFGAKRGSLRGPNFRVDASLPH
jgi:hypothetical protein